MSADILEEALSDADRAALRDPSAHPGAASGVREVQTHISHVFLTRDRVAKFRKAVDLGFVRFRTRAERNADCLREVALNRRLAPDVYLGVAPLLREDGRVRVGPVGETLQDPDAEHCVVMRRLPDGRDAQSLLATGHLGLPELDRLACRIAAFHAAHGLGAPAPFAPEAWLAHLRRPVEANFGSLAGAPAGVVPAERLARARARALAFAERHTARFEARRLAGRAVDGHGDLHLQHVWFERDGAEPLVIDCVEFDADLRRIDAASEVAFTAMDLRYRGAPLLAEAFLAAYARESDDFDLYSVVDFFVAYRAGVRAKVAAIAAGEAELPAEQRVGAGESARRHLLLADDALAPRAVGTLVLVAGIVGTGKSTAAAQVAEAAGGAAIASDRVRKRLAGLAPEARAGAGPDAGIYDEAHTERTYTGLLERARPVLLSGRVAVLDATFARTRHRDAARRLAEDLGAPIRCVETRCDAAEARARLARRRAAGRDPSDAGPALHATSAERFEPLDRWPEPGRHAVRTDREGWLRELRDWASQLGSAERGAGQ